MRNMTIPQVKKMVGTEFIYIFPDGETIPAVIAAFVPKEGFTVLATETVDSGGFDFKAEGRLDKHGNVCLIGISSYRGVEEMMERISIRCREIRDTGTYTVKGIGGHAHCALS